MNIVLYDMNASITTIFGGKAWDIYWELGQAKARPNPQHKSREYSS